MRKSGGGVHDRRLIPPDCGHAGDERSERRPNRRGVVGAVDPNQHGWVVTLRRRTRA